MLGPEFIKNVLEAFQKAIIFDWSWGRALVPFVANLAAKAFPKLNSVGSQIDEKLHKDSDNLFDRFLNLKESIFGRVGPQLETQNPAKLDPRGLQNRSKTASKL